MVVSSPNYYDVGLSIGSNGMRFQRQTIGLLCGFVAIASFVVLYATAVWLDTKYVFGENYLSDLGVREGAWAFNAGVIIAGALFVPFALLGIRPSLGRTGIDVVSVALMVIAGLFLVSIGIFTEDAGDLHGFVSYGFFLTMLFSLGFLSYSFHRSGPNGRTRAIVALAAFVLGLALLPFGGTPLVETIAVLSILVWGLLVGLLLLRR